MALIALLARVTRSTNRSTPCHGDHRTTVTERYRGQGLDMRELRQAGDVVDLDCTPFFIDRVEDAVASGPQAPESQSAATPMGSSRRKPAAWSRA